MKKLLIAIAVMVIATAAWAGHYKAATRITVSTSAKARPDYQITLSGGHDIQIIVDGRVVYQQGAR